MRLEAVREPDLGPGPGTPGGRGDQETDLPAPGPGQGRDISHRQQGRQQAGQHKARVVLVYDPIQAKSVKPRLKLEIRVYFFR